VLRHGGAACPAARRPSEAASFRATGRFRNDHAGPALRDRRDSRYGRDGALGPARKGVNGDERERALGHNKKGA